MSLDSGTKLLQHSLITTAQLFPRRCAVISQKEEAQRCIKDDVDKAKIHEAVSTSIDMFKSD